MKITIYTTTDCQFSKQEREYLASHNLQYEEKNLETNKEFLTEMLAVSNNFAGTPVTRVEKDDGTIAVLKGFTKEEFDAVFGFAATPATTPEPPKVEPTPAEATPIKAETPATPQTETAPTTPTPPPIAAAPDPKIGSVLDKLEEKAAPPEPVPLSEDPVEENPTVAPTDAAAAPTAPTIPDFPTK